MYSDTPVYLLKGMGNDTTPKPSNIHLDKYKAIDEMLLEDDKSPNNTNQSPQNGVFKTPN